MRFVILLFVLAFVASACSSPPILEPRRGGNPEQVDLSGNWVLRTGDELPVVHEQTIRIPKASSRNQATSRPAPAERPSNGASVHLFLESGKLLKVSQTIYGIFFSFDRAVVEEYNFGENRIVSIGPIQARRVSGWEGPSFVVDTMDERGNVLTERWRLEDGALVRDISIARSDTMSFSKRQVFDPE
jgi:hypothetical protein